MKKQIIILVLIIIPVYLFGITFNMADRIVITKETITGMKECYTTSKSIYVDWTVMKAMSQTTVNTAKNIYLTGETKIEKYADFNAKSTAVNNMGFSKVKTRFNVRVYSGIWRGSSVEIEYTFSDESIQKIIYTTGSCNPVGVAYSDSYKDVELQRDDIIKVNVLGGTNSIAAAGNGIGYGDVLCTLSVGDLTSVIYDFRLIYLASIQTKEVFNMNSIDFKVVDIDSLNRVHINWNIVPGANSYTILTSKNGNADNFTISKTITMWESENVISNPDTNNNSYFFMLKINR